jgi:CRP-like cAMP-binding protein
MQRNPPAMLRMLEALATEVRFEDGSVLINLSVSQATLAGLVGATRENVNRALRALTAEGKVRLTRGKFAIPDLAGPHGEADRGRTPLHHRNRIDEGSVKE